MSDAIITGANMASTERGRLKLDRAITGESSGRSLENNPGDLKKLLLAHVTWIETAGKDGQQLNLSGYDLRSMTQLNKMPLTACKAQKANFISMTLSGMHLQSAHFEDSDFRDSDLSRSDMRGTNFSRSEFTRANMRDIKASPLKIGKGQLTTNMSGCIFKYADFENADLRDVNFTGADLSHTNLNGADLRGAIFEKTKLFSVYFEDAQIDADSLVKFIG
jgi:uncharacterized protein YjbI with pentapeptide repeats